MESASLPHQSILRVCLKYLGIWNRIFLANKQVAQLGCSAESIARYVTGAAARLSVPGD